MNYNRDLFKRIMALLLCAAMLLTVCPIPAVTAEATEDQTSAASVAADGTITWSINHTNYFVDGDVIALYKHWAINIANGTGFNDGVSESWKLFCNDNDGDGVYDGAYKHYTAFIVENLGGGKSGGYEYFVDAVIDGSVYSDEAIYQIKSHTSYGYVILIPTAELNDDNMPSRGDLVDLDYWISNPEAHYDLGVMGGGGAACFTDNPASAEDVHSVGSSKAVNLNATVNMFNYDETINNQGAGKVNGEDGFGFWAGFWGYGGEVETVDGEGLEAKYRTSTASKGIYQYPKMSKELDENGYPMLSNGTSLGYLFDGSSTRADGESTKVSTVPMTNGGGLFQKDADGYYYYDSLQNAAYYDADYNKFVLYEDLAIRPWYNSNGGSDYEQKTDGSWGAIDAGSEFVEAYGNFLPFNEIRTDNVTIDGDKDWQVTGSIDGQTGVNSYYRPGSLEYAGLNIDAARQVLGATKGVSSDISAKINSAVTTARLEDNPDMWFGMTVDFEFYMPKDGMVNDENMVFDFHGDDDVFVYVGVWNGTDYDYKLTLDMGGVHEARTGLIDFATGDVTYKNADGKNVAASLGEIFGLGEGVSTFDDYTKLSLKFFYLERGGNISYCSLRFNMPTLPQNSLTVTKEVAGEGFIEDTYDYQFRVVKADENGNPTTEPLIKSEMFYLLEGTNVVGAGRVNSDGVFTLKAGQSALFENLLNKYGDTDYVVQEILPEGVKGQYSKVEYHIGGGDNINATDSGAGIYSSSPLDVDQVQTVVFHNTVNAGNLSSLSITKTVTVDASEELKNKDYEIQVKLDGEPLPKDTVYTIGETSHKVDNAKGIIKLKNGETAVISGILSGTEFEVLEIVNYDDNFRASYAGTVEGGTVTCDDYGAEGTFPLARQVSITVTNKDKASTGVEVDKKVTETDDPNNFNLTLEAFATGETSTITSTKPADIVLVLDQSASMYTPAGYPADRLYADKDLNEAAIPASAKVDLVTEVAAGNTQVLENAKHTGYYIAVANGYLSNGKTMEDEYLYIVQYAEYKDGDTTKWGWFYVPVDMTARSVKVDTANTTKSSTDALFTAEPSYDSYGNPIYYTSGTTTPTATLRQNESLTCCWDYALMRNFTYYKTQYGELYDSIKSFVTRLNETNVDHNIAIVGFSSPFFDAMDHYEGTGMYVDGEYYLYDSAYAYKGKYVNGVLVRDDENGDVVLDPEKSFAGDTFEPVEEPKENYEHLKHIYGDYANAFASVKTELGSINKSIEAIETNYLQTCPAIGIRIARNIFRGEDIPVYNSDTQALDTSERDKIIVLFTDGVPTVSLDCTYDNAMAFYSDVKKYYEYWDVRAGAASAINEATLAKEEGITIYTIGTGAAENLTFGSSIKVGDTDLPFLDVVSSNYTGSSASFVVTYKTDSKGEPVTEWAPKSTTYTVNKGTAVTDGDYAAFTTEGKSLDIAFDNVLSSVTASSVSLNGDAVLREVLSDYFQLLSDDKVDINVYTQAYLGNDDQWADKVAFAGATVTLTDSDPNDNIDRKDVIEVTGFDYQTEFVSNIARAQTEGGAVNYYGSKLVVEVSVTRRDGFWGGNNVPTNKDTTGIYFGGEVIEKFPIPEANVPINPQIAVENKTIYYGGDVDSYDADTTDNNDLLTSITLYPTTGDVSGQTGYPVTINPDGSLTSAYDWADDYADLTWTVGSTIPGSIISNTNPADYTYSVTMAPKHDGSDNQSGDPGNIAGTAVTSKTASDTAHVYILVPEITFEDSVIKLGEEPGADFFKENDYVKTEWVLKKDMASTEGMPDVIGSEPALTLSYTAGGTDDGSANFQSDTKVNVTVSNSDIPTIMDATTFKWETCTTHLHDSTLHGTIGTHAATKAKQHEFWVHVVSGSEDENGLVTDKKVSAVENTTDEFILTLEGYAMGEFLSVSVTKPADINPEKYSSEVNGVADLELFFQQMSTVVNSTGVKLDGSAVLKEVLTDYFELKSNSVSDITVYTQAYKGNGEWADKVALTTAKVALSASDNSHYSGTTDPRYDTISVSGFDYTAEYISETARAKEGVEGDYFGSKIVVEVHVKDRAGFWGGNNIPTNESDTGIYTKDDDLAEIFPEPEVHIPMTPVVMADDKTVYYGGDVDSYDDTSVDNNLLTSITIDGKKVTIMQTDEDDDGLPDLVPEESWMADFADLTWNENSTNPGTEISGKAATDYEYSVTLTPKKDGNGNKSDNPSNTAGNPIDTSGTSAKDSAHVYVLIPEVTFKDSAVDKLGTDIANYNYTSNNLAGTITWVNSESVAEGVEVPDPVGAAPDLTLTYKSEDSDDVITKDTKVDVTVSCETVTDIDTVTTFMWQDCESELLKKLHGSLGKIETHDALKEGKHEFWIHVPSIVPDTVVIDFGLDVVIDVLDNDPVVDPDLLTVGGVAEGTAEGTYGQASIVVTVDGEEKVQYSLNTSNGMQMEKEDAFAYTVRSGKAPDETFSSTVTVIPATSIYFEDSFVTYSVYDYDSMKEITSDESYYDDVKWTAAGTTQTKTQAEDRPGKLTTNDANNIYGFDAAYEEMGTYSMGSAMKVVVGERTIGETPVNTYAEAKFTFSGTGFDVISLTSNKTGTIVVQVKGHEGVVDANGKTVRKNYLVDTYYGYVREFHEVKYTYQDGEWIIAKEEDDKVVEAMGTPVAPPENPKEGDTYTTWETRWVVSSSDADNALYQIPVIKAEDLPYGTYDVIITVSHEDMFDHAQYNGEYYDFYLDAIRIYDPANDGADNEVIEDAYEKDGEGWPEYFELRDLLISANDFNSSDDASIGGIIFIDGNPSLGSDNGSGVEGDVSDNLKDIATVQIEDYANYGPNNELYLAPGQAVAFDLEVGTEKIDGSLDTSNIAGIHIAMKSVGGTAKAAVYDASDDTIPYKSISTATDLYYDITLLNGKTVVIINSNEEGNGILSITNIKVTYKSQRTDGIEEDFFKVNKDTAETAVAAVMMAFSLRAPVEDMPETTVPETTVPETTVPETTVPETTVPETTVPETTVPEETEPETDATEPAASGDTAVSEETTGTSDSKENGSADTGDSSMILLWTCMLMVSALAVVMLIMDRRTRKWN